jgi:hypothetical protein
MRARSPLFWLALFALPAAAPAQHGGGAAPTLVTVAPREAAQFDFLVGPWTVDVQPAASTLAAKIHGVPKMVGTWKAWRALDGWGIEDELRIIDDSGNPRSLTHAVRVYDAAGRRWNTSTLDVYRGAFSASNAESKNGEMMATSSGVDKEGHAYNGRSRFYDITPSSFRVQQERSTDGGKSWSTTLRMQAKRLAATAAR